MRRGAQRKNYPEQLGTVSREGRERCPPVTGAWAGSSALHEENPIQLFSCHTADRDCASSCGLLSLGGCDSTFCCTGAALCRVSSDSESSRKWYQVNHLSITLPSQAGKEHLCRKKEGWGSRCLLLTRVLFRTALQDSGRSSFKIQLVDPQLLLPPMEVHYPGRRGRQEEDCF